MPIYFNGNDNPKSIKFNGTSLDKVVCNGATVWESASSIIPDFPETIPLITISTSDGKKTYVRNATLSTIILPGSDGKWIGEYTCEFTFEVAFTQYGICVLNLSGYGAGSEHEMRIPDIATVSSKGRVKVSGVSGVPSGFSFESLTDIYTTGTFWLPTTQQQMYAVSDNHNTSGVSYGTRYCWFELYNTGLWGTVRRGSTEYALCYRTTGLVCQEIDGTLRIKQA